MSTTVVHPALKRQEGEPSSQYAALLDFAADGPGRKRNVLARRINRNPGTVLKWARRWHWDARLANYDLAVAGNRNADLTDQRTKTLDASAAQLASTFRRLIYLRDGGERGEVPPAVQLQACIVILRMAGVLDVKAEGNSTLSHTLIIETPERPGQSAHA